MSCAGSVRLWMDGQAEADARSDQLLMLDLAGFLERRPVRTTTRLRTTSHSRAISSGWFSNAQITSESRKSRRYCVGLTPQTSRKTCAKCC
jgi:hypothetical protein